jgi:hypothetical protein
MTNTAYVGETFVTVFFCLVLIALQFAPAGTPVRIAISVCLAVILFSHYYQEVRGLYGLDGSFQVTYICSACLLLGSFTSPGTLAFALCIWYVFIQCILSYVVAGIAKSLGKPWRDGTAVGLVLGTHTYGSVALATRLVDHPHIVAAMTYSVLAFELSFPIVALLSEPLMMCFLMLAVMFHIANALVMGLNQFLLSFICFYPSILFCWYQLHGI